MFNKTIFVLRSYLINKQENHYPCIELLKGGRGFFRSLRRAEKATLEIVRQYASHSHLTPYAFHIAEIPWNSSFKDIVISERLYDGSGALVDRTVRSEGTDEDYEKFTMAVSRNLGRTLDQIRFQVGDLVEVIHPRRATSELMIVGRVPFSPERVKELENDTEDPATDIPDEYACLPIGGEQFKYYPPTRLVSPVLPLTDSVAETYRKYMAEAKEKRIVPRITWF